MTSADIEILLAPHPDVLHIKHLMTIYGRGHATIRRQIAAGDFDEARLKSPPLPARFAKSAIRRMLLGVEVGAPRQHFNSHKRTA